MGLQTTGLVLVIFLSCVCGIQLDGHGYTGVVIAINPAIPKNEELLKKIEDMIKDASHDLYHAVGKRFYFKEVTILVPPNWNGTYEKAITERYDTANVIIDEPNKAYGDEPYTLQYGQCGEQGQHIHLTPNFLLDDMLIDMYGKRGKVFVHEWAHLRWGVYDEYSEQHPFYRTADGTLEPTRCSKDITGFVCSSDSCGPDSCINDPTTGLPNSDCLFVVNLSSKAKESMMAYQALEAVTEFCSSKTHNAEAPNRQNQMCGRKAVMDVIVNMSVDAGVKPSAPIQDITPIVRIVQKKTRVVCLTLDVSGSMGTDQRIIRLRQAATLFLREIIEDTAQVGIVQFSSAASVKIPLTVINGAQSREELVKALPTTASGGTYVCQGLKKALEVLKRGDNDARGEEIIILTDGEASDQLSSCMDTVIKSNAIVHNIALGPNAEKELNEMANKTGGISFYAADSVDSNELVDAFASLVTSDGNLTHQAIQLESAGKRTADWFNGTFSVDWTVGNGTVITIVYESSTPTIFIRSPSGNILDKSDFDLNPSTRTLSSKIPGTAEVGEWHYSLLHVGGGSQAMAITVTSRAASADVPPITVKAHMSQKSSDGSNPLVIYAVVTQNGLPVIMANVTATLESDKGHRVEEQLEDNGAGADAVRHDGVYSKYFFDMKTARYSLKVRVRNGKNYKALLSTNRHSGALYIPGYVVNGQVQMNPPKPPVNHEPVEVGSFSRTATGESFAVDLPAGYIPAFPPCKIIDLKANLEGGNVTLTWTAPGETYDQGTASHYHIHWSEDLELLTQDFNQTHAVNTSGLSPQEAGSTEEYSFLSSSFNITNGTQVFFAITAENAKLLQSEMSNIVQVVKYEPPEPEPEMKSTNVVAIAVSTTVAVLVVIILVILALKF